MTEELTENKDSSSHRISTFYDTAKEVAKALGETEQTAFVQIMKLLKVLGAEQIAQFINETLDIEENGGLMINDGSRRRTMGGVFFFLCYSKGKPRPGMRLPRRTIEPSTHQTTTATETTQGTEKVFIWQDRLSLIEELKQEKGTCNVKIVITGRPGATKITADFTVILMEGTMKAALPKGLPAPKNPKTLYSIYISKKQWNKVSEAIKDADDILIIEGTPMLDGESKTIAVFATNVTTKKLQIAQREAQKSQATATS